MTLEPTQATLTVSPSEFYDRLAILDVKLVNIQDPANRESVRQLYEAIAGENQVLCGHLRTDNQMSYLYVKLKGVHLELWGVENQIRDLDGEVFDGWAARTPVASLGIRYMTTAKRVYTLNDRRTLIKRRIDALFGQEPEVKEYKNYGGASNHAAETGEEKPRESKNDCGSQTTSSTRRQCPRCSGRKV